MRTTIRALVCCLVATGCQQSRPFGYDDAEQLCVLISSCLGGGWDDACEGEQLANVPPSADVDCALAAGRNGDCNAVRACMGRSASGPASRTR
jgi:hypothetical protein